MDIRPTHLVITLADESRDGLSYHDMRGLQCAGCGCRTSCEGGCSWVLPGLCSQCANRVVSVTVSAQLRAARQTALFAQGRLPD